jgi:sialate O-acetylesterase
MINNFYMKSIYRHFSAVLALSAIFTLSAHAEDLRKIVSLSGYWKFSIGDDLQWASPAYDDSDWDQIAVPDQWEEQGYRDYNGYAWYRKTFKVTDYPANTPIFIMLGRIDDADMVYLNGKLLGKSGMFPPDFVTAYDQVRKYTIPAGLLKKDAENIIAVRVYDTFLEGGIVDGPAGMYYDADNDYLSVKLNGRWKFRTGDNKEWRSPDFNDADWKTVNVPSDWESQGYSGYDGYAWYRVKFRLPQNFSTGEMYLSLGKIDDTDEVYLNGKLIGTVYNLKKDGDYRRSGWEYNARRLYKLAEGSLNRDGLNTLAIRVYDGQIRGGIYEGPIGIMSAENYRRYKNKHYKNRSFWDEMYDQFVEN